MTEAGVRSQRSGIDEVWEMLRVRSSDLGAGQLLLSLSQSLIATFPLLVLVFKGLDPYGDTAQIVIRVEREVNVSHDSKISTTMTL